MRRLSIPSLIAASLTGLLSGSAPAADPAGNAQELLAKYTDLLQGLKAEIAKALPAVDEQKKAVLQKAREAVKKAAAEADAAGEAAGKIDKAKEGLGIWRKYSVPDATKRIAEAKEQLKTATTEEARKAAQQTLAAQEKRLAALHASIKEAEAEINKPASEQEKLNQAKLAAQKALAQAQADELAAARALLADVNPFLAGDKLDATLVKGALLSEATPQGLAEFARQGHEQEALVEKLLADDSLMKQMLVGDGAKNGHYGRAMKIYTDIRKASPKAQEGPLQRLALAISLEHAVPIAQSNPKAATDAPATVDPVRRYLHYEKAFLEGELDPGFKDLAVWEYRMAVNGDEPDSILAWGREMLRNYRPDHVFNPNYGWRYSEAVRTDVRYGSQDVKNDRPTLQNYQNIIMNGGVCGRRAFFGRFILRSFGIPTVARPQTGHAALAHWTPEGWVINLGAGWGHGRVEGGPDTDFLLMTQARKVAAAYLEVQRAQWVARALGEPKADSKKEGSGGWWNTLALYKKMVIVAEAKSVQLAALGTELGEANESAEAKAKAVVAATPTEADRKIVVDQNGVITIPAAACGGASLVKSFLGGQQMICGGGAFSCDVEVPRAGKYVLTARVVMVHDELHLPLTLNNAKDPIDWVVPYTCGLWEKTRPVEVTLVKGKNTLSFSKPANSFALKDFTLTPVKP